MSWQIKYYSSGTRSPVDDFIKSLQPSASAKLIRHLDLLEELGPKVGMPIVKPLGQGLYEIRVRGNQEVRVFYCFAFESSIYLLHGFIKKTNAIPNKELRIALARKKELELYN